MPFLVRFRDISGPFDLAKSILDRKYKETQLLGHRRLQKGTIRYINFKRRPNMNKNTDLCLSYVAELVLSEQVEQLWVEKTTCQEDMF